MCFLIFLFLFEDRTSSVQVGTVGGRKDSTGVIVGIVVALILCIIGIVMLVMWKRKRNEKQMQDANEQGN